MHLLDQRILGVVILVLLGMLVTVKQLTTGSILDKPRGGLLIQAVNIFNLFFLLVVNPLAATLFIMQVLATIDPTPMLVREPGLLVALEVIGLILYAAGFLLMAWALITLGRFYQLGGSAPRLEDRMITSGPYRLIRHPMYAAALSISLGLAFMIQSWAFLCVFFVYLALILLLIPLEEKKLRQAYGERYTTYQHKVGGIIPFIH